MNSKFLQTVFASILLVVNVARAEEPAVAQPATKQPAVEQPALASTVTPAAAIPAEDTAAMESKIGSEVVVEGMVKKVGKAPNDSITFLNFGDSKSGFVAIVFRAT